jgi:hypothetical protein
VHGTLVYANNQALERNEVSQYSMIFEVGGVVLGSFRLKCNDGKGNALDVGMGTYRMRHNMDACS